MANFLIFDSVNDYLVSPLSHTFSGTIVMETNVIPMAGESIYNCMVNFSSAGRGFGLTSTQYMIRAGGSYQLKALDSTLPFDEPSLLRVEVDVATSIMRVFINNVEQASSGFVLNDPVTAITNLVIGSRSATSSSSAWGGKVNYLSLVDGTGALIDLDVDASLRGAGATIITDTVAGNDATGYGFPTDGSQYEVIGGDPTPDPIDLDFSDTTNQPTADTLSIELITQLGITGTLRQPTADTLTTSAINELVLFDNLSQPSADTVDLSTVTVVGLLDNARQPSADVINLSAIGELVFSDNTRQPTADSVQIEQVSGLVLNDNSRQPTVDTLSIELYTQLSFADTLVQVSADTITLTSKTLPQFGKNDIMMIDNSEDYQLTDNSIEYKAK